ncbi:MAG: PhnD/SsuA/transferrin family substrate-binding protein [Pseudomonadota bacterium]
MIAALQMYAWPEVRTAAEAYWAEVVRAMAASGVEAPATLSWPDDLAAAWRAPGLLLGQTCGLPYVHGRCADAVIVARPDYGVEGATGGAYRSALIARHDGGDDLADFRGKRAALNELTSQSGCNALAGTLLRAGLADHDAQPFFGSILFSGAHRRSAEMVADGEADLAAIDAVAWALFQRLDPGRADCLKVVAWSDEAPALPFITGRTQAEFTPLLVDALNEAARTMAAKPEAPPPGIPRRAIPSTEADFRPIRDLGLRLAGLVLAPGAPPLPALQ